MGYFSFWDLLFKGDGEIGTGNLQQRLEKEACEEI